MNGYWLNHYFPKMLKDSINQMPSLENVENAMTNAEIEIIEVKKYSIKSDLRDQFLYCGKQNPELYFDENIRHGISSFSSLANRKEIERGLSDLRKDIDKGKIGLSKRWRAATDTGFGNKKFLAVGTNITHI